MPALSHRRRLASSVLVVAVLALAGCGSGDPAIASPAARVNGTEISRARLLDTTQAASGTEGSGAVVLPSAESSQMLDVLIQVELVRQHLEEEGVELGAEERAAALDEIHRQFGQDPTTGVIDVEAGRAAFEELEPVLRDLWLNQQMLGAALVASLDDEEVGVVPVTDDDVQAAFDESAEGRVERCVTYLQADPDAGDLEAREAAVDALYERIQGGEPIDELVAEVNEGRPAEQQLAGDLGCSTRADMEQRVQMGELPPEAVEAVWAADGPGPIEPLTIGGSIAAVLVITSEDRPTLADLEPELRAELEAANDTRRQDAAGRLVDELALAADVWVDARFGRWVGRGEDGQATEDFGEAVGAGVVPPQGPADAPVDDPLTPDPLGGGAVTGRP